MAILLEVPKHQGNKESHMFSNWMEQKTYNDLSTTNFLKILKH